MYMLGRNGEPIADHKIQIQVSHKDFSGEGTQELTTDSEGKVALGQLADIEMIYAKYLGLNEFWKVMPQHKD